MVDRIPLWIRHEDRRRLREMRLYLSKTYAGALRYVINGVEQSIGLYAVEWLFWTPWTEIPTIMLDHDTHARLREICDWVGCRKTEAVASLIEAFDETFAIDYRSQYTDHIG